MVKLQARNEPGYWRTFWSLSIIGLALGWYITGSPTLGYESKWFNHHYVLHRLRDPNPAQVRFTEDQLAMYNGKNPSLPILLAIDGMVFDVSARPETYGPLGSYHFFSAKDAARAYATGCFQTHLTHDLRGLSNEELEAVESWKRFFENNVKYWHVGYVDHPPLVGEPPESCHKARKP